MRLAAATTSLFGTFLALALTVFTTNFEALFELNTEYSYLVDKDSLFSAAKTILAISLNGFSLITVSFIVVFLLYGLGTGMYCGVAFFK